MTPDELLDRAASLISRVPQTVIYTQCLCAIDGELVLQSKWITYPNCEILAYIYDDDRRQGLTCRRWCSIDAKIRILHKKGLLK